MDNEKKKDETLSWAVILPLLLLSGITAWLILEKDWDYITAYATMAVFALGFAAICTVLLYAISPKEYRKELMKIIIDTAKDDLRIIWKMISGNKKS